MANQTVTAPSPAKPARARNAMQIAAIAAPIIVGFLAAFTSVWNFDLFWHLASGEWMYDHLKVLGTDPFSVDPQPQWVNVHWLFQVVITGLYKLAGFGALSLLKAVLTAGTMFAFIAALRRRVNSGWLAFCALAMLFVTLDRIRVRPEIFTLLYLTVTILLMDSVRRGGSARRLWWLAGVMLLWVNMHGVYVVGLVVIWGAFAGALVDRMIGRRGLTGNLLTQAALVPAVAATIACFVSPWPVDAALQPLLLMKRISGEVAYYTYGVSEFVPTWTNIWPHWQGLLMVAVSVLLMSLSARRVSLVHLAWLAPFVVLALMARRNVALLAPLCALLMADYGQMLLARIAAARPRTAVVAARAWQGVIILACLALAMNFVTSRAYRGTPSQFGPGLEPSNFPIAAATWLADLKEPGDVVTDDFGDAGAYIYYLSHGRAQPARLLLMDGRLEAHDLARFILQHNIRNDLRSVTKAIDVQIPRTVRFVNVRFDSFEQLQTMIHCPQRFRIVFIDSASVVFEDLQWAIRNGDKSLPPGTLNIAQYDKPMLPGGWVEGAPRVTKSFWRQNPPSMNYRLGVMFLWLSHFNQDNTEKMGEADPLRYRFGLMAIRYLTAGQTEGIVPPDEATGYLADAYSNRCFQDYARPGSEMALDVNGARALRLMDQINFSDLSDPLLNIFAMTCIKARMMVRQFDVAQKDLDRFMKALPPAQQVLVPQEYLTVRDILSEQLKRSRQAVDTEESGVRSLESGATTGNDTRHMVRARKLADAGLIDEAISGLSAVQRDADSQLFLGDLLLRKAKTDEAREAYNGVRSLESGATARNDTAPSVPGSKLQTAVLLRLALCDWVDGKQFQAADALQALCRQTNDPEAIYYRALLLEEIGDYKSALASIADTKPGDLTLAELMGRLKARLNRYAKP